MTSSTTTTQGLPIGMTAAGSTAHLGTRNALVVGSAIDLSIPLDRVIVSAHEAGRDVSVISLEWSEFDHPYVRPYLSNVAVTLESARDHLSEAVSEFHRRLRLLEAHGASSWEDLPASAAVRPLTIVVENVLTLTSPPNVGSLFIGAGDPSRVSIRANAIYFLKQLVRGNRADIQIVTGASEFDRFVLPAALLDFLPTRVLFVPLGDDTVTEEAVEFLNVQPSELTRLIAEAKGRRRGLAVITDYRSRDCDSFWVQLVRHPDLDDPRKHHSQKARKQK